MSEYWLTFGLETNGFVVMTLVLDMRGAVLLQAGWVVCLPSRCGCTELWASCLVPLQLKQRATSTSLHFIPLLMSCDRHSALWGSGYPASATARLLAVCAVLIGWCWRGCGRLLPTPNTHAPTCPHMEDLTSLTHLTKQSTNYNMGRYDQVTTRQPIH